MNHTSLAKKGIANKLKTKKTNRALKKSPLFHCATYTLHIEPITTFRGDWGTCRLARKTLKTKNAAYRSNLFQIGVFFQTCY
jgi:hypothetical protein